MFGLFKKRIHIDSNIDTLIGRETRIQGNMQFAGGLRIDGTIKGSLKEDADHPTTLIIGETGVVTGAVEATKILLGGQIAGPVMAFEFIELQSHARIVGDLHYKSLELHMGAVIEGRLIPILDKANISQPEPVTQTEEKSVKFLQANLID